MNKPKAGRVTTRFVVTIGALLLVTNIVLGSVLMVLSTSAFRTLIRQHMLSLSTTAAGLLDGDALGALTEADVGNQAYNDILNRLAVFQSKSDVIYIYAVRQVGADDYVFTVDPDPEKPAAFGSPVVVTDGLRQAARGKATVDTEAAEDEWGVFYSAFCPVFDSRGQVAGIVGVDFDSQWYDRQSREYILAIGVLSVLFVGAGIVVVWIITRNLRRGFRTLDRDLGLLSGEMDELMGLIASHTGQTAPPEGNKPAGDGEGQIQDEIGTLGDKVRSMQKELQRYLAFVHAQTYTDALTQVGNTTAYTELQERLDGQIQAHTAAFGVAVFDINLLKEVNDRRGHAAGDRLIRAAAEAISDVFGPERTYRIGGDEFVAVALHATEPAMTALLVQVEENVKRSGGELSLSAGAAVYRPGQDRDFQEVFVRSDRMMYQKKEAFHSRRH